MYGEYVDGEWVETDFAPLVVAEGKNITLDLNEYTLNLQDPLKNNGTLTITGGNNEQWTATASIDGEAQILIDNYGELIVEDTNMWIYYGQVGIYNYEGATVNVTGGTIYVDYSLAEGTGYGIVYVNEADVTADDSLFSGNGIYKKKSGRTSE